MNRVCRFGWPGALLSASIVALVAAGAVSGRPAGRLSRGGTPDATTPCGVAATPPSTYSHVIWILFENKAYSQVVGSRSAPYINGIAKRCGLATNYNAIAHPSLPNYIGLTSGSTQGITVDTGASSSNLTAASIFSQLGSAWRSLEESMPSNCSLSNSGLYVPRHNPAVYYTNIRTVCRSRDVPLTGTPDISARFTFVTPNLCNDMHSCSISTGDRWLAAFLPKILNSSTYAAGGTAVFVTWDEGSGSSNHIPTLVISPTTPAGVRSSVPFNHYSLLRTTEAMLGLGCLAKACKAASMRSAFRLEPDDCVIPKVRGKSLRAARRLIKTRGCRVGKVKQAFSARVKKGHVISQKPRSRRHVSLGAKVNLVISKGRRP